MAERLRVYLSSTYEDLKEYRAAVFTALEKAGLDVARMETYTAADKRPLDLCLQDLAQSDIYVGLYAWRYGYPPPAEHGNPDGKSITELEYRHAEERKLRKLLFFAHPDTQASWPERFNDEVTGEGERGGKLAALRKELGTEKTASFFRTPDDLATLVLAAIMRSGLGGRPYNVPARPPGFVPRGNLTQALLDALLGDGAGASGANALVQGAGGFGKTTLAIDVCHRAEVVNAFPDGILWIVLGEKPDLRAKLSDLHVLVTGSAPAVVGVDAIGQAVAKALEARHCLIVVDDAWRGEDLKPFLGFTLPRLLVTTRIRNLLQQAKQTAWSEVTVDEMLEDEAAGLLGRRLPLDEMNWDTLIGLANQLGCWPLLLDLANARLLEEKKERPGKLADCVARVTKVFERSGVLGFDRRDSDDRNAAIERSVNAGLDYAEELFPGLADKAAEVSVFPKDIPIPVHVLAELWEMDKFDVEEKALRPLDNLSILHWDRGGDEIRLHDMIRRALESHLSDPAVVHRKLVDAYRKHTHGSWADLCDDGYILGNLTWHLERAERAEDIHCLLTEEDAEGHCSWYVARESRGQTAGYLADVSRAWRLAQETGGKAERSCAGERIGRQVRYALCQSSINSLAAHLPSALLVALVAKGIQSAPEALLWARQKPDAEDRALVLTELVARLPEALKREALDEAMSAIREITYESFKAHALLKVTPLVPVERVGDVLALTRSIQDHEIRSKTLAKLVPHLPNALKAPVIQEVLAAIPQIGYPYQRAEVLVLLAPHLSAAFFKQAWDTGQAIEDRDSRADALTGLAPYLPRRQKRRGVDQSLAAAEAAEHPYHRSVALTRLLPVLDVPRRTQALSEAIAAGRANVDQSYRAGSLAELAPHLSEPVLVEALEAALDTISDRRVGTASLARLAPHLSTALLNRALEKVRTMRVWKQAPALATLAPYLPEELRNEWLESVLERLNDWDMIWYPEIKAEALVTLLPHAPTELKQRMIEALHAGVPPATGEITRSERRKIVARLGRIAAQLTPDDLKRLLAETPRTIEDDDDRAEGLARLASSLPHAPTEPVLSEAFSLQQEERRIETLAALMPRLNEAQLEEALARTRATAWSRAHHRARALAGFAAHLAEARRPGILEEALGALRGEDATERARSITEWISALPEPVRTPAIKDGLRALSEIRDVFWRALALVELAPYVSKELLEEALDVARSCGYRRAWAVGSVGVTVPDSIRGGVVEEACAAARTIKDKRERVKLLIRLIPHLSGTLAVGALVDVRTIDDPADRARALAALATHLRDSPKVEVLREALGLARSITQDWRRAYALAGVIQNVDTHQKAEVAREALVAAKAGRPISYLKEDLLLALMPFMTEPERDREIAAALDKTRNADEKSRASTVVTLAQHLPNGLVEHALGVAIAVRDRSARHDALIHLCSRLVTLPLETLYSQWCSTLRVSAARSRRDLVGDLQALTPVIARLGGTEAVELTAQAVQDVGRWWP